MKKIFFVLTVLIINAATVAQQAVKISAQIRPRTEFDNRDFISNTAFNNSTSLRTRLNLSFIPAKDFSGFVQLQDSRFLGGETNTTADMKNVDLHQAYFKIDNFFNLPIDVKAGRMEVAYGNERFIGAANWSYIGRSFDGIILTVKGDNFKVDIFDFKEFEKFNLGDTLDHNILGLYSDLLVLNNYKIQPFLIWQKSVPSKLMNRFTPGIYVKGDIGAFTHEIEFAYQFGDITASSRQQSVSAFMFALNAAYTFETAGKPTIGAGIEFFSGDDNQIDNDYKTFNTLYGTNHKFYGYMDYFTDLPAHTYGFGLIDMIGKVGITPYENFKASLTGHIFSTNADYKLKYNSTSKNFGTELDLVLNYKYNDNISFEGGASMFLPGEIFKEKKGSDNSTWFYLMAVVSLQ